MASRITEFSLDCRDPGALAGFWAAVLGWEVRERSAEGWIELAPPGQPERGPVPTLVPAPVADPTPGKLRLHLDLDATDRDQAEELDRLLALGARRADVGQSGDESWHVLADPEGNEFCLLAGRVRP
jgi:predicted enzyme related to lactoylglutathione lyase